LTIIWDKGLRCSLGLQVVFASSIYAVASTEPALHLAGHRIAEIQGFRDPEPGWVAREAVRNTKTRPSYSSHVKGFGCPAWDRCCPECSTAMLNRNWFIDVQLYPDLVLDIVGRLVHVLYTSLDTRHVQGLL